VITSIDELAAFTRTLADKLPELRDSIVLQQPGYPQDALDFLSSELPGIPQSYLSVVKSFRLDGIAIGYFQLSPQSFDGNNLIEKLIACNKSGANPFAERHQQHGVYQVASWEADPICVVYKDGPYKKGQIVKYSVENPTARPIVLADTFEQFLVLAGNLDAIRDSYSESDDSSVGLSEFRMCLAQLASQNKEIIPAWEAIASIVLL
jgi:hypothetical protein